MIEYLQMSSVKRRVPSASGRHNEANGSHRPFSDTTEVFRSFSIFFRVNMKFTESFSIFFRVNTKFTEYHLEKKSQNG